MEEPSSGEVEPVRMRRGEPARIRSAIRRTVPLFAAAVLAAASGYQLRPRSLPIREMPILPRWERVGSRDVLTVAGDNLIFRLGTFRNEFFAWLMYNHLRAS